MSIVRDLIGKLKTGVINPEAAVSFLRYRTIKTNRRFNYWRQGEQYYTDGTDIFEEDWDNLIILDACRYDEFRRCCDFEGRLERRTSYGSMSEEFVRGNFTGADATDTVYVSSNLWYAKVKDEIDARVHRFIPVDRDAFNGETSHPETVTETARDVAKRYPNKRLIVHYLQPHQPYFGEDGERFRKPAQFPSELASEPVNHEDIVDAYRTTLQVTLTEVEKLLNNVDGRTVITADHGELLGERSQPIPIRHYGHPRGAYVDELLTVPWFVVDTEKRKQIVDGGAAEEANIDAESVDDQLKALGYKF